MNLTQSVLLLVLVGMIVGCHSDQASTDPAPGRGLVSKKQLGLNRTPTERLKQIKTADKRTYNGTLPTRFNLSMPPVEPNGQGNEGACVAWATTYTARSYPAIASYTNPDGSLNYSAVFSPEYVYNQIKISSDCDQGAYFVSDGANTGALDLLMQQGVCVWNDMPYTDDGCSVQPTATQKTRATSYKITRYEKVVDFSTDDLKKLLLSHTPLMIGATVDEGFANAESSFIWKAAQGQNLGGHALVIVGYDDTKNAFCIQNSWGTIWGDKGYSWLDYSYYNQVVFEAFILYVQ